MTWVTLWRRAVLRVATASDGRTGTAAFWLCVTVAWSIARDHHVHVLLRASPEQRAQRLCLADCTLHSVAWWIVCYIQPLNLQTCCQYKYLALAVQQSQCLQCLPIRAPYTVFIFIHRTSSPAVAKRARDASCLSVISFNNTIRRAQSFIISYFGFIFTNAYN